MKTVYLIRHAKSSWEDDSLSDFDRPLNDRGKTDAPRMAKRLKAKGIVADLFITSPAKRARSTAKRIAEEMAYKTEKIVEERSLYHAEEDEIMSVLRNMNDKYNCIFLFGHNPGLTDFVNQMSRNDNAIENIPTCGVVAFRFKESSWRNVDFGKGDLIHYDFPKNAND